MADVSIVPPLACPVAMALNITIMTMARMSSNIRTLITLPANCCCRRPKSSKALYMIVVELMANMPPRKMQSIFAQPKAWPTLMPNAIMQKMMMAAEMTGEAPIFNIFLKEKSSPKLNSVNITPISAQEWILASSTTDIV